MLFYISFISYDPVVSFAGVCAATHFIPFYISLIQQQPEHDRNRFAKTDNTAYRIVNLFIK